MPTIVLKSNNVIGKVPTIAELLPGEVAINTKDGKLYAGLDISGDGSTDSVVQVGGVDETKVNKTGDTMTGDLIINADLTVSGTITETSASKYKENIVSLNPAESLIKIMALNPVNYIKIDTGKLELGLIAEEVELVLPEIVTYKEEEVEGLNYSRLVSLLASSIQELKAKQDLLELEILSLKA